MHHRERETRSYRGIHCIATFAQYLNSSLRRQPMNAHHHSVARVRRLHGCDQRSRRSPGHQH